MPRSLVVDVVNIVERRAAPANHQGVRFSVATNGNFTVATNIGGGVGTVFAGVVCGVLALLINIRDLLADSLTPRP